VRSKESAKSNKPKGASRLALTLRSLVAIVSLGVLLAIYNAVSLRRDIALAVGPEGPAQREFFKNAADRPDITTFFKNLTPEKRLKMAQNIGRYDDMQLASLCGKCLDNFDPEARAALTNSLAHVALVHPDAVAAQFTLPGSFQQLAIATALRRAGPSAIPLVDKQLSVGDARPNAVAYLVASGAPAIAPTLPYLDAKDKDTRLAAVDALGKLRATEAVNKLIELYHGSVEEERLTYFTALVTIGEPSTEPLMRDVLTNDSLPTPLRAQAALGLGRIGSTGALNLVWSFTSSVDQTIRDSSISALQLAGDTALRLRTDSSSQKGSEPDVTLLQVAGGIRTEMANRIIQHGLEVPSTAVQAARVAGNRPELVPLLTAEAQKADATTRGDIVDALLRSLTTTAPGRTALKELGSKPDQSPLAALAARRLILGSG